jgi:hypothetical protein
MTRHNSRNARRFRVEFLEGRNAPSHFGVHAVAAHAVTQKVASSPHQEVRTLDRNDPSPNDSTLDSSHDSSRDVSKDSSRDPSSRS